MPNPSRELWAARAFARLIGIVVEDSIAIQRPDPPDIKAKTIAGQRLGIELVEYQSDAPVGAKGGSPAVQAQQQRSEIGRRAQVIFEDRNDHLPLVVTPFCSTFAVMKVNRADVAQRLAHLVETELIGREPPNGMEDLAVRSAAIAACGLAHLLDSLRILWGSRITQPLWDSGFGGVVGGDPQRFQMCIDRKGGRQSEYSGSYDLAWLLVHVGFDGLGEITGEVTTATYELDGFDAVYFFDSARGAEHQARQQP
jgi:hypothetical protein